MPPTLDVVENPPTTQRVVRDVEHMVGLAVRPMTLQDQQMHVECIDQPDSAREHVHDADPAA